MEQSLCKWSRDPGELVWRHKVKGDRVTVYRVGNSWLVYYRKVGVIKTAHHDGDIIKTADNWTAIVSFLSSMGISAI